MSLQGGGGASLPPGLTGDGSNGIIVADSVQIGGSLNVGDLTNPPNSSYTIQLGPGGNSFFVFSDGTTDIESGVIATGFTSTGGPNIFTAANTATAAVVATSKGTQTTDADIFLAINALNVRSYVDGAANLRSDVGLGIFGHTAPAAQPVLATGAGHTVDDIIALLQSYGICKQL